jgi:hypothetical protein
VFPLHDIAPLARTQLAAWEDLARDWIAYYDPEPDTAVAIARCVSCHTGLWRITDEAGHDYQYTAAQMLALKVAHLRQAHQELDPDRPGGHVSGGVLYACRDQDIHCRP